MPKRNRLPQHRKEPVMRMQNEDDYEERHNKTQSKMKQQMKDIQDTIQKKRASKKKRQKKRKDSLDFSPYRVRKSEIIQSPKRKEKGFWESVFSKLPFF